MTYDSRVDTYEHIERVRFYLHRAVSKILERGRAHDASKLVEPEKSVFDEYTPKLAELTYDTDAYRAALEGMGEALRHHYRVNSHHPEAHEAGISGMTLLDLIEMLCDWKAATERHPDGDLYRSIEQNQRRFDISPQLTNILFNTARELGL